MRHVLVKRKILVRARSFRLGHYFALAQAKRTGLSETGPLAWAKAPSLSENRKDSCFLCTVWVG